MGFASQVCNNSWRQSFAISYQIISFRSSRLCVGGGCGIATVVTPLYLSETAPPAYKNRLGIANQSFIVLGVLLTQSLAIPLSRPYLWRFVPIVSAFISFLLLAASPFVEESRVWLQHQARKDDRDPDTQESDPLLNDGE
jgi:MFS family permease